MLTAKGWARRSSIVLIIMIALSLILAGCGSGGSPSAGGGGLNPTRTVGKKATAKPTAEEETEEPTEEETEEPTEEETDEPTEETEEPTDEANTGGEESCILTQSEVEDIVGESVTEVKEEGTAEAPQCTYTTESISIVSINVNDAGSEEGARMGIDFAKSSYEDVEELDDVGDGAILAMFSGFPLLQGYKGSTLLTLTYVSLSKSDPEASKQIMIDLANAAFDKL